MSIGLADLLVAHGGTGGLLLELGPVVLVLAGLGVRVWRGGSKDEELE